jgi:hypothetical protein
MVLEFACREGTRDVDLVAMPEPRHAVAAMAQQVADEVGWRPNWLNDDAGRYVIGHSHGPELLSGPGIRVTRLGTPQMLALKLAAMRDDVDRRDAVVLARSLGLARDSVELAIAPFLHPGKVRDACFELEEIWQEVQHGH